MRRSDGAAAGAASQFSQIGICVAIAHLRASIVGAARSPVAAAAYRHRAAMFDTLEDRAWSYKALKDLAHEEIALPEDAPRWIRALVEGKSIANASEALWTAVAEGEKRVDAQFARDLEMALPLELSKAEQIALVRDFVAGHLTSKGMVADWVMHTPDGNPHVHLMHTLRPLTELGFGNKKIAVRDGAGEPIRINGKILYKQFIGGPAELKELRLAWGDAVNRHLALAGHDIAIDMRSYADQGLAITPTTHIGPVPRSMMRQGLETELGQKHREARTKAAKDIERAPMQIVAKLSRERSTFGERDIAKELNRYIDDPVIFTAILAKIKVNPELVRLRPECRDPQTGEIVAPAVFSTRELIQAETAMARAAGVMAARTGFAVRPSQVAAAIAAVETKDLARPFRFDAEQVDAVKHVTRGNAIAVVAGFAGAGKSTLLEAVNIAWTHDGRRVFGGALAGKAAEGLEASSGIASRTLASWELAWKRGKNLLRQGDVFVIDEAGMVGSRQMSRVLAQIVAAGAKAVLVGDARQLQPIEAGAAFRVIADRVGYAELVGVRRQNKTWAQDASKQFARGETAEALEAYHSRGHVRETADRVEAAKAIVADWTKARAALAEKAVANGKGFRGDALLVLAHTNKDVYALNQGIREVLTAKGALTDARTIETERGTREFATGDRILFLKNERFTEAAAPELGRQSVKNGMLGTVTGTAGGLFRVRLDSGKEAAFRASTYRNIDHGYATTIHKSQGVTVDQVFVLGTPGLDQHLTYVAMSRHRERVTLYTAKDDFPDFEAVKTSMSRSGAKTTTLDFEDPDAATRQFAERRGIDRLADIVPAFAKAIEKQTAWITDSAERLGQLWQRAEAAIGLLRERALGQVNVEHTMEKAEAAGHGIGKPLRLAQKLPDLTPQDVQAAFAADAVAQKLKAAAEQIATTAFGSAKPIAKYLGAIEADPKAGLDLTLALRRPGAIPEPLAGHMGGLLAIEPDATRKAALDAVADLPESLDHFARRFVSAKAKLQQDHSVLQARLAVEIPAPSAELTALLTNRKPDDLARLTTDMTLAGEFAALHRAFQTGLSHEEKRAITGGGELKLGALLYTPAQQSKALAETYRQTKAVKEILTAMERQARGRRITL